MIIGGLIPLFRGYFSIRNAFLDDFAYYLLICAAILGSSGVSFTENRGAKGDFSVKMNFGISQPSISRLI